MSIPTAIIAMGGNSISPKGETGTIQQQFSHTRETVEGISHFVEHGGSGSRAAAPMAKELFKLIIDRNELRESQSNFEETDINV